MSAKHARTVKKEEGVCIFLLLGSLSVWRKRMAVRPSFFDLLLSLAGGRKEEGEGKIKHNVCHQRLFNGKMEEEGGGKGGRS